MRLAPILLGALALVSCDRVPPDVALNDGLPSLASQHEAPRLAMLEYMLATYFAADVASRPTTCASIHDGREEEALPPEEEQALMERFPRLAPMSRCMRASSGWRDSDTEEAALVFTLHNFTCASGDSCSAWGGYSSSASNSMSSLYRADWDGDAWHFTRDNRTIADPS